MTRPYGSASIAHSVNNRRYGETRVHYKLHADSKFGMEKVDRDRSLLVLDVHVTLTADLEFTRFAAPPTPILTASIKVPPASTYSAAGFWCIGRCPIVG